MLRAARFFLNCSCCQGVRGMRLRKRNFRPTAVALAGYLGNLVVVAGVVQASRTRLFVNVQRGLAHNIKKVYRSIVRV